MSNKRITVSSDAGTTNYTLPGNTGDTKNEVNAVVDTVFGQLFESDNATLSQWSVTANGIFKGVAGYNVSLKKGGTPTTMTAEACAQTAGQTYQVTDTTKRVISYEDALTVFDNAVDQTANVDNIDYLTGKITFKAGYTVTGPITVTGKYIPLAVMAKAKGFNLTQSMTPIDASNYDDAQANAGYRTFAAGLKKISLKVTNIFAASNAWLTALQSRAIVYVELDLNVGNAGATVARGFFKITGQSQSGKQGDLEQEEVDLTLYVPDGSLVATPFNWYIAAGSKLNTAIQKVLAAFTGNTSLTVTYMPTGVSGNTPADALRGDALVTEATLANAADGQNEFSFSFRGTGEPTQL